MQIYNPKSSKWHKLALDEELEKQNWQILWISLLAFSWNWRDLVKTNTWINNMCWNFSDFELSLNIYFVIWQSCVGVAKCKFKCFIFASIFHSLANKSFPCRIWFWNYTLKQVLHSIPRILLWGKNTNDFETNFKTFSNYTLCSI